MAHVKLHQIWVLVGPVRTATKAPVSVINRVQKHVRATRHHHVLRMRHVHTIRLRHVALEHSIIMVLAV